MKMFEYKIVESRYLMYKEQLDELGGKGWELCNTHANFYIFKREVVK